MQDIVAFRRSKNKSPFNVVLTNYSKLHHPSNHWQNYQKIDWMMVVLDEGHAIKNSESGNFKACMALTRKYSVILTGKQDLDQ